MATKSSRGVACGNKLPDLEYDMLKNKQLEELTTRLISSFLTLTQTGNAWEGGLRTWYINSVSVVTGQET